MTVNFSIQNLARNAFVRSPDSAAAPRPVAAPDASAGSQNRADLVRARNYLLGLLDNIEKISGLTGIDFEKIIELPVARSDPSLALNLTPTAATYRSFEEINAIPTSFTPFGPAWSGSSDALLTIGGVYDGSDGTGNISFEVRREGTHGQDDLRIRVRDPLNGIIANVNVRANHAIDRQYDIQNGLYFTLGAGDLVRFETATVAVFDGVGSAVDPNKAFDGVRNENPNLEFGIAPITDGSFTLNGEVIGVSAGDTLNDVVDTINQSAAGLTAAFNPVTEQIEFTQLTEGSVPSIVIENDSSNFVAATKLAGGVLTPGTDPEPDTPLANVASFSTVQAGNITVNGVDVAVDPGTNSLNDVIAAINAAGAQVSAAFDPATQRITLTGDTGLQSFTLDGNATNFFSAVNISEGEVRGTEVDGGLGVRDSSEIANRLEEVFSSLNELYDDGSFVSAATTTATFRGLLDGVFQGIYGDGDSRTDERFGIEFDRSSLARRNGRLAGLDRTRFARGLRQHGSEVRAFLDGGDASPGLISGLASAASEAIRNLNELLGTKGGLVDRFA